MGMISDFLFFVEKTRTNINGLLTGKNGEIVSTTIDTNTLTNKNDHVPSSLAVNSAIATQATDALITSKLFMIRSGKMRTLISNPNGCTLPLPAGTIPSTDIASGVGVAFPVATQSAATSVPTDLYWARVESDGSISLFQRGTPVTTEINYMVFTVTWAVL